MTTMQATTQALPTEQAQGGSAQSWQTPAQQTASAADRLYGDANQQQQRPVGDQTQPAGESARPAEAKANAETAKADAAQAPQATYELKNPDGAPIDSDVLGSFSAIARDLNLSQEAAQTMLDRLAPKVAERQAAQLETFRQQWTEQSRTDREFGGERLAENLSVARKALESFGSSELRTLLNESGLGNHPEIIRFMVRAGRAISEDRYVGGNAPSAKPKNGDFNSLASALYPT